MYWCKKCRFGAERIHSWGHPDENGKNCDGKMVEFELELPAAEGWETEPPPPPTSNGPGTERELWWFFGLEKRHPKPWFRLELVENALLGSGSGAWQMLMYRHDFVSPKSLTGYWKRLVLPTLPATPVMPRKGTE